ncbi:MAG: class I adenylate-forming enzyme family protein [Halanaerobiales bacterium]
MNYCELLYNTDEKYLDCEALIDADNGRRLTYRELMKEVAGAAGFLDSRGYKPGDVIATHLYNSIEAAVVLLAVQYIGGVICLVDPLFKTDELDYYIKDSGARCLITHLDENSIETLKGEIEVINIEEIKDYINDYRDSKYSEDSTNGEDSEYSNGSKGNNILKSEQDYYDYDKDELAMLLYTSGSTSTPKGVMLSTECFFTFLEKSNQSLYRHNKDDRLMCFVPFSHAYGSVSLLVPALDGKAALVFLRSFHPTKVAQTILDEKITHMFGVPTHYQQLLRYESIHDTLKNLKAAFSAASPLSFDTAQRWYKVTGIHLDEGYGMTETTTLISTRMSMLPEPGGNVGFPPEGILEIEAVNENNEVCEDGIIGELRVKGKGIMLGYLNRPQATEEVLRDGWLYTGDLGYRRSDGSFVVCGRRKEFINVAGLKISPIEIEAALNSHESVLDSAAIGIEDTLYGELVKAFVVLRSNAKIRERDLIRYVSDKIANFKVPRSISIMEELPRNNMGKIDKKALKNIS